MSERACVLLTTKHTYIHNWENVCSIHADDDIKRQDWGCRFFIPWNEFIFLWLCIAIWLCIYFTSFHFLFLSLAHTQKQTQIIRTHGKSANALLLLFTRLIFPFRVEMLWDYFHLCHGKQSQTAQTEKELKKEGTKSTASNKAQLFMFGNSCDDVVTRESVLRV